MLIGSMNPEEGDLRPQLLDRFGLAVDVVTSTDPGARAEAVRRRLGFDADPDRFVATWGAADRELKERLATVRPATVPDEYFFLVLSLTVTEAAALWRWLPVGKRP